MKEICVLTASRAEYGLLKNTIQKLRQEEQFNTNVIVTGMHLEKEFGETYREIEADGIPISAKIPVLAKQDGVVGVSETMATVIWKFTSFFSENPQDILIVLGDRYETMAVCIAAMNAHIPIAHIHGGEITEGAIDEAMRHSITKMSYLHFTSTEDYRRRVIQLGESPERVFCVGAPGVENILRQKMLDKQELEASMDFCLGEKYCLVTFHPVTLEQNSTIQQLNELFRAMEEMSQYRYVITKANADAGGQMINERLEEFAKSHSNKIYMTESLGMVRYLSAMKYCSMVIGNSSSGILEAPAMRVPTVNIGDRQRGRIQADSIINCEPECGAIKEAMRIADSADFNERIKSQELPYGDGHASENIVKVIKEYMFEKNIDLKKKFYDIKFTEP